MNILHTSDWHLGRTLYKKNRYEEFDAFLTWLAACLKEQDIDVLIVAGDIFDTTTPSHRAQEQYYRFLQQVAGSHCRHIVIVGGNHDSPSFLNAPQGLLASLHVYVVGKATADPKDQLIVLHNELGQAELIVCAIPYLRDQDIRTAQAGESSQDKASKLTQGMQHHYDQLAQLAQKYNQQLDKPVPVVATGHLFTAGGKTQDGDGVRELYVGTLAHITADLFSPVFDYVALGHLHVPQRVGGHDHIRYCGSPLPMGFGEAKQQKIVHVIHFEYKADTNADTYTPVVRDIPIPVFKPLLQVKGDWTEIENTLTHLVDTTQGKEDSTDIKNHYWLEITYTGKDVKPHLMQDIQDILGPSGHQALCIKNNQVFQQVLSSQHTRQQLEHMTPTDVFTHYLDNHDLSEHDRHELELAYQEIIQDLP